MPPRRSYAMGLSPRVRGNRNRRASRDSHDGSIPACAGEPASRKRRTMRSAVYPRVCGGTGDRRGRRAARAGLSPRVRGNRIDRGLVVLEHRSIPACAGEPRPVPKHTAHVRVYPRVCGGTAPSGHDSQAQEGLSPRVRGNRRGSRPHAAPSRSIPACAGEPPRHTR